MSGFELDQQGFADSIAESRLAPPPLEDTPSLFHGSMRAIGSGVVRGVAKLNDLLLTGTDLIYPMSDEEREQQGYLREHALNAWTPESHTLGAGARALGGFSEILPALAVGGEPAGLPLLAGSETLDTGKQLIDENVDAKTAGAMGAVAGLTTAAGFKVPFLGKTLATRMLSGAAGNLALNAGSTEVQRKILQHEGYNQLAENYSPLDGEARLVDVLSGALFGGLYHAAAPSEVAGVATINNAKHYQVDTAPGRIPDVEASAAHQAAMDTATDQVLRGEPVNVPQEVLNATFEKRPPREMPIPDEYNLIDSNRAEWLRQNQNLRYVDRYDDGGARPLRVPHDEIAALSVPEATKAGLAAHYEKAAFVKPFFDDSVRAIARDIGAEDAPLIPKKLKSVERAAEKTMADYAGDASKVKDLVRATVVVRNLEQAKAAIKSATERLGEPTKLRNTLDEKVETPDGYRDINMNFNVDGHTVELQVNFPEMLAAKEHAHALYDERRSIEAETKKTGEVKPEQLARMESLDAQMKADYAAAWKDALSRSKASSEISTPSSRGSLNETGRPSGTSQARTVAPPSAVGTMETGTPSQSKNFGSSVKKPMSATSGDIVPPKGATIPPEISAVRQSLADSDMSIPTGEVDAQGKPVVRSAREIMAQAEAEIAEAEKSAKGFDAAVSCFLMRGPDAS